LQAYLTPRTSYRQTLFYLPANWKSFIRWSPDQWVSQCYAIEYYSFYIVLCFVSLWLVLVSVQSTCALNTRYFDVKFHLVVFKKLSRPTYCCLEASRVRCELFAVLFIIFLFVMSHHSQLTRSSTDSPTNFHSYPCTAHFHLKVSFSFREQTTHKLFGGVEQQGRKLNLFHLFSLSLV
jgi:hypothetical protein